jgi:hypothetical protein
MKFKKEHNDQQSRQIEMNCLPTTLNYVSKGK